MDFNSPGHVNIHDHQFNPPQGANGPPFATQYRHIEHHIDSGASRSLHPSPTPHILTHDNNGNMHQYYQDANSQRPETPSQQPSPRFATLSPAQPRQLYQPPHYVPQDRSLPDREVTDDNLNDVFVDFVLYCNPSFPTTVDTTELKRVFRTPPKSDGNSFNIFALFELIKRYEAKEIKTWQELALLLGVEKPSVEKGQSSQKVQQYSVRLKRWMKALHIDAFFEYLIYGKERDHAYYRRIPPLNEPFPDERDGVAITEDLVIRALDPKYRPKRGRRRADEQDDDMELTSAIEPKRPHLDTSFTFGGRENGHPHSAYPASAIPLSAHPDDLDHRYDNGDIWSALTPSTGNPRSGLTPSLRWKIETPSTPHPNSNITPSGAHPDPYFDEPQSAVTPGSSSRNRKRRHGPGVSAAWSSTNTTVNGKLRGRPRSNQSVRDGPYNTFPANPNTKEGPTIDLRRNQITTPSAEQGRTPTPGATDSPKQQFLAPQQPTPISATTSTTLSPLNIRSGPPPQTRPERLQVQVPQHVGNPVSLLTPTVLVNGRLNDSSLLQKHQHQQQHDAAASSLQTPALSTASTARSMTSTSSFFTTGEGSAVTDLDDHYDTRGSHHFLTPKTSPLMERGKISSSGGKILKNEDVKRALAAELLRAEISGRSKRLRGQEAKELAESMLRRSLATHPNDPGGGAANGSPTSSSHANHLLTVATWLGLSIPLGLNSPLSQQATQAGGNKKITVRRFRVGGDGYDSPLDDDSDADDPMHQESIAGHQIRESFDIEWSTSLGGIIGAFSMKGLSCSGAAKGRSEDEDGLGLGSSGTETGASAGGEFWKERFLVSERKLREIGDEVRRLRDKVLDAVL